MYLLTAARIFYKIFGITRGVPKEHEMKHILLLEDDENLNRGISLKLSKEGYHVFSACTISEAKSIFSKESIDLVISDITLPDGNGLDFGKVVREKSNAVAPLSA